MPETRDTQSRKWQLTINNPQEHGFPHSKIKDSLVDMKSLVYYCLADEQGLTPHTHLYVHFSSAVRFSTLKNAFPPAHFEMARGTARENRDYIAKEGKWEKDEKHGTRISGTFEEWGELPLERQGQRSDLDDLYDMIRSGMNNCEIYQQNSSYLKYHGVIEQVRQDERYQQHKGKFRDMRVIYIWGETGVGKTRYIYESHCMNDIYRVTDYQHPFDSYGGEPIMAFDEFRSQLPISDMLNYLDRYPLKLPSRYTGKQACYTTVYIITNEMLCAQYVKIQREHPDTWKAFVRRINELYEYTREGLIRRDIQAHVSGAYVPQLGGFRDVADDEQIDLPF